MIGTEKQIKWAEDLRKQLIKKISTAINLLEKISDEKEIVKMDMDDFEKANIIALQLAVYNDFDGDNATQEEWRKFLKEKLKGLKKMLNDIENYKGIWNDARTYIDMRYELKKSDIPLSRNATEMKKYGLIDY